MLCTPRAHGYNHLTVARSSKASLVWPLAFLAAALCLSGCAAVLGPGYLVENQEIKVSFTQQPSLRIHVSAEYHLKNTGNRPLDSLDVRLPGQRFHPASISLSWDGGPLPRESSPDNPRDTLLRFSQPWSIGDSHSLKVEYDIASLSGEGAIGFSADAFYLPAEGWTPALPQIRGLFGFGGVPPKKWFLVVRVPPEFLIHASGGKVKRSGKNDEMEFHFAQSAEDLNPFVIAGRYKETRQELAGKQKITVWTRAPLDAAGLQQTGASLSKTLAIYDSLFGQRGESQPPLWIVECPSELGCLPQSRSNFSEILYGQAAADSSEMISRDTVVIDPRASQENPEASAGPALASGWLGYGQNPGFYEQQPPMSALPVFAVALAREASAGPQVRLEIIRRALAQIPPDATRASNGNPAVARAKSLLLFYALRDRVGAEAFQKAMRHMLYARQRRGFDITDLISALEEESHQPLAAFVRAWLKQPGVPPDFRATNSQSSVRQNSFAQEATR